MLIVEPFEGDSELPKSTQVVVIGGGIAGVCTALFLADRGIPVVLCEKGVVGGEQSSRNWGWTRVMGRDEREMALGIESVALWRRMSEIVGADVGFRESGIAYICKSPEELHAYESWLDQVRAHKIDASLLGRAELARVLPGISETYSGGLYTPTDGRAEPTKAVPAIARGARNRGAVIVQNCAVRGVETTAGRISEVVTEKGTIACNSVVLAGGAWSRLFAGNLGLDLPQLKILGSVFQTAPLEGAPDVSVGSSTFGFRRRQDGGYIISRRNAAVSVITPDSFRLFSDFAPTLVKSWSELRLRFGRQFLTELATPRRWRLDEVSPFEKVRVLDPEPHAGMLAEAKRHLIAAFPAFQGLREVRRWGGLIDATPDAVPVISDVASLPGFFLATGFSGHGFGLGPGAGKLMADIVEGSVKAQDAEPYRFDRFVKRAGKRPFAHLMQG